MWDELISHCEENVSVVKSNLLFKQNFTIQKSFTKGFKKIANIEKSKNCSQPIEVLKSELSQLQLSDTPSRSLNGNDIKTETKAGTSTTFKKKLKNPNKIKSREQQSNTFANKE